MPFRTRFLAAAVLCGGLLFACGGDPEKEQPPSDAGTQQAKDGGTQGTGDGGADGGGCQVTDLGVSFSAHVQPLFDGNCVGCHAGAGAAGGLNLSSGASYGATVNRNTFAAACGVDKRVVPCDPSASLLYLKVTNTQPSACGVAMPQGSTGLAPAEAETLRKWIAEGAPQN